MKKGLIFLLGIISFLGINTVSAEEIYLDYSTDTNHIKTYINEIGFEAINMQIESLISYYEKNYSINYPFYYISFNYNEIMSSLAIILTSFEELNYNSTSSISKNYFTYSAPVGGNVIQIYSSYFKDSNIFSEININNTPHSTYNIIYYSSDKAFFNPYSYYYSNFDLYYKGSILDKETLDSDYSLLKSSDSFYISSYNNQNIYNKYNVLEDFILEPHYLYDDNDSLSGDNLTTINLNDYSYVILSLKDYTPRETFTTTMYVKGQLCPTTVYNYGLHEKKEYVSGWQSPNCGTYSNDYVRHLNYIRKEDIENNAVYYLTGYDSSKPNSIKIDTSIYDITYITKEEENNPVITIDGKKYQSLPYSDLTDTSILTEKEGFKPNYTCGKYDTDCFLDSSGVNVKNLFSNPLETLKGVWDAILSIFALITNFIALLPPTMQAFLILAFGVGTALGIIKILL